MDNEPQAKWYFTFMQSQHDLKDKFIVFEGTFDSARKQMTDRFGLKWAFQYSEAEFAGQKERFGLEELV